MSKPEWPKGPAELGRAGLRGRDGLRSSVARARFTPGLGFWRGLPRWKPRPRKSEVLAGVGVVKAQSAVQAPLGRGYDSVFASGAACRAGCLDRYAGWEDRACPVGKAAFERPGSRRGA